MFRLILALLLSAASFLDASRSVAATESLVVYSGRGEALVGSLLARFQEESGITLRVSYADSAQLASTLVEEADRSPADVFFAQDYDSLSMLAERGLLATLPESLLSQVESQFRSASGHWIGTSARARVLAWNTDRVDPKELPADVNDLVAERWRGRLGWAPENASFHAFLAAMVRLRGRDATHDWVCAVQANKPRAYPSNTPLVVAVGSGEIDAGLANHYYLHRLRAEHGGKFPVANHYFRNGAAESMLAVSGVAIVASSQRQALAERLVSFLVSAASQTWMVEKNFEFPVRADVALGVDLPAPTSLQAPALSPSTGDDMRTVIAILRECGVLL